LVQNLGNNHVLDNFTRTLSYKNESGADIMKCLKNVAASDRNNLMDIIRLENFRSLVEFLDWENGRQFSLHLCELLIKNALFMNSPADTCMVLSLLTPLIMDNPSREPGDSIIHTELFREQDIMLRALLFFYSGNQDEEFEVCINIVVVYC
jgi:hypothetical protein